MAIYHCSVQCLTRVEGRSVVAAAAYRSGERLTNCYDGITHDYTKKRWIIHQEIMLPKQAPVSYKDRGALWNAVEMAERSSVCRLAREVQVALPLELTMEENIALVQQYVQKNFVSQGMCADIAIHSPPKTNDRHQPVDKNGHPTKKLNEMQFHNPHAHILLTVRPMDEKGMWQPKSQIEYVCIKDGEEKGMTAAEFKQVKDDGWEKQYHFISNGKKVWLPASAGKELGLERVSKMPKTIRFGRENPICKQWNSEESIIRWRKSWEDVVNQKFQEKQLEVRIDSRSFKDQGREEEIPTIHLGPETVHMNRRAERLIAEGYDSDKVVRPEKWYINEKIKEHNRLVNELKEKFEQAVVAIKAQTKEYVGQMAKHLESLRNRIISAVYESMQFDNERSVDMLKYESDEEKISYLEGLMEDVKHQKNVSERNIQSLQKQIDQLSFIEFAKKRTYLKQIEAEQHKIDTMDSYVKAEFKKYGVDSVDFDTMKKQYKADQIKMQEQQREFLQQVEDAQQAYMQELEDVPGEYAAEIQKERRQICEANESRQVQHLKNSQTDDNLYRKALQKVNQNLAKAGLEPKAEQSIRQGVGEKQNDISNNRRR